MMVGNDTLTQFRAAIAADPNVQLLDKARQLTSEEQGAERDKILAQAATSGQPILLAEQAWYLAQRGHKADAVTIMEHLIETNGRQARDVYIAVLLLFGSPSPEEINAAFAHLAAHSDQLTVSLNLLYLCQRIRTIGLHDRFIAVLRPELLHANTNLSIEAFSMYLESGLTSQALDVIAELRKHDGVAKAYQGKYTALHALAARLADRRDAEPTAAELRTLVNHQHRYPLTPIILAYLAMDIDRATAIQRSQTVKDGDEIYYYLALDALANGDRTQGLADLNKLITGHPTWVESGGARRLITWLETNPTLPRSNSTPENKF